MTKQRILALSLSVIGLLLAASGISPALADSSPDGLWSDTPVATAQAKSAAPAIPKRYRAVSLSVPDMQTVLSTAPMQQRGQIGTSLYLPMPDGSFKEFLVEFSPVMAPGLAAKYPEITTYRAVAVGDAATSGRLDFTPQGFHAMIRGPEGTVFIDPANHNNTTDYVSYNKRDATPPEKPWQCLVEDDGKQPAMSRFDPSQALGPNLPSGATLRTYELAVAATAEYSAFHGGTKPLAQAAIVTAINRVNELYNRDLAIHLELIANNDDVVYIEDTPMNPDPFTNNNGVTMLSENQTNMDVVIGDAFYDIGHVFSTGGGGVATLNSPCDSGVKARGVTGLPNPIGDPFYIDFVSHEMGHQFDGRHTFNGTIGSCGGNRSPSAAFEPGSGSTIQAYAGICGAENLQSSSDANFHTHSFQEIVTYTTGANEGNTCDAETATGNSVPVPNAGSAFTIPIGTPFMLTGSATDANGGDVLTYSWEQYDLGPASPPSTDDGFRPIFRSFPPTTSPTRLFPRLSDILSNSATFGESLPTTNRSLTFRMTVRDNALGGGGVDYDTVVLTTTTSSGPFAVTSQNSATQWTPSTVEQITWDVANTTAGPVSCASVDIDFSADGGQTFSTNLTTATPNDGFKNIIVPNLPTLNGRVRVKCSNNIFLDINNANIIIPLPGQQTVCSNPALPIISGTSDTDSIALVGSGNLTDVDVSVVASHTYVGDLVFTLNRNETATTAAIIDRPGVPASTFGCPGDNIDVLLDDAAGTAAEDLCSSNPAIGGTASPNDPLSAFNTEARAGTWNLTVSDVASPDDGTLDQWCITTIIPVDPDDPDGDGILTSQGDNCPNDSNPNQEDFDGDGVGYACDTTCASMIDFMYSFSNGEMFELLASDSIKFQGSMASGSDIILDGANSVALKNNTSIKLGAQFRARSDGCIP